MRRRALALLVVTVAAALALAGCKKEFEFHAYEAELHGVVVLISPPGDEAEQSTQQTPAGGTVKAAGVTVELKNRRQEGEFVIYDVTVNGEAKGTVRTGGDVVVAGGKTQVSNPPEMQPEYR
jgi:hypothetical protein